MNVRTFVRMAKGFTAGQHHMMGLTKEQLLDLVMAAPPATKTELLNELERRQRKNKTQTKK